jgi:hypothetical protein
MGYRTDKFLSFILCWIEKMAAQGGTRDKILRVSMPFERGKNSTGRRRAVLAQKRSIFGNAADPWAIVLKVRSWAAQLREGGVHSRAEIARREGITRARVSQLWPLSMLTSEQMDEASKASKGRDVSIRRLIRVARNPNLK